MFKVKKLFRLDNDERRRTIIMSKVYSEIHQIWIILVNKFLVQLLNYIKIEQDKCPSYIIK